MLIRPDRSGPPRAVASARAIAGVGLAGDVHADALSPRQLLLAGSPAYAAHALDAGALSENLLLDMDTASLTSGALLQIGAEAVLWLSFQCEPCGQLNLGDPGLAKRIGHSRGMLARVLRDGVIRPGDGVSHLHPTLPGWSNNWRARVVQVLAALPAEMVIDYKQLARLAGVAPGYCRVFPRVARELGLAHRVVATHSPAEQPRWQGWELFDVAAFDPAPGRV